MSDAMLVDRRVAVCAENGGGNGEDEERYAFHFSLRAKA